VAEPFEQYERLFWRVLARLARLGYVLPPGESRDIIHDFYLEAWENLLDRFDPSRGKFSTYLFTAFYRFARRRIVRWHHWHRPLRTLRELAVTEAPAPAVWEDEPRLAAIRTSLARLRPEQREALQAYLAGAEGERALALRYGMTRYRLRETLIDALGQVLADAGEDALRDTLEGRAALSLWRDGLTVPQTARLLGISAAEVQTLRRRLAQGLLEKARSFPSLSAHEGTLMTSDPLRLLRDALLSPWERGAAEDVKRHASQIREALETDDLEFSHEEIERLGKHGEWTAAIYAALSGPEEMPEEESEIGRAIDELHARTDKEIAQAFVLTVESLPPYFHDWASWFRGVPEVSRQFQEHLLGDAVVRAAMPHAWELVPRGLTPAVFIEAARGLELLCNRLLREASWGDSEEKDLAPVHSWIRAADQAGRPASLGIALPGGGRHPEIPLIPYPRLVAQVRSTPQCPPQAAEPLLWWLVEVGRLRPFLVRGYEAEPLGERGVRLTRQWVLEETDLVWRWTTAAGKPVPLPSGSSDWSALGFQVWESARGLSEPLSRFVRAGADLLVSRGPDALGGEDLRDADLRRPVGIYYTAVTGGAETSWRLRHTREPEKPFHLHALTAADEKLRDTAVSLTAGGDVQVHGRALPEDDRLCYFVALQAPDLKAYSAEGAELIVVRRAADEGPFRGPAELAGAGCFAEAWAVAARELTAEQQFASFLLTNLLHMERAFADVKFPEDMKLRRAIVRDCRQLTIDRLSPLKVELLRRIDKGGAA
jgi:RNA polymerase sigma factor (sigma-70 family)